MQTQQTVNGGAVRGTTVSLAGVLAAALALSASAHAGYTVTDLGTLPGLPDSYVNTWGGGMVINNRGHVAVFANNSGSPVAFTDDCSFLWAGSGEVELLPGLQANTETIAMALNDRDQVVGWSGLGFNPVSGVIWQDGAVEELQGPGSQYNSYGPLSINNAGTIVGLAATPDFNLISGLVWYGRRVQILPTLTSDAILTQGQGINDNGEIVGLSGPDFVSYHAVLWKHGRIVDLGTLGGLASNANAINNQGQIVGQAQIIGSRGDWHAALWQRNAISDLGNFGSDTYGIANGINSQGQIVGFSGQSGADIVTAHALLWQKGSMTDLQTLIPISSNWVLQQALGINERGQIAGIGLHNGCVRAYLLTPTNRESGKE